MGVQSGRALAVTGLGAATSVGWDVVTAAASVRAGISRATELFNSELLDEETHETTAVIGHPLVGLTDGFVLYGRWMRLARTAVDDLIRSLSEQVVQRVGYWERSMLLLATRTPDEAIFLDEPSSTIATIESMLGLALLQDLRLPIPPDRVKVLALGHAAGAAAVQLAGSHIGVDCDRALIVAVDTMLDPIVLEQLASENRLRHGDNAAGLIPGEAAAVLLLEPANLTKPAAAHAVVTGVSIHPELPQSDEEMLARVGSLPQSFVAALDQAGLPELTGDIYIDLNGEPWRAHQWGMALLNIQDRFHGRLQLPAMSVGDVGAAASVLGMCLASRAFARGYSGSDGAAVLTTGEAGGSTCVVLETPGAVPHS